MARIAPTSTIIVPSTTCFHGFGLLMVVSFLTAIYIYIVLRSTLFYNQPKKVDMRDPRPFLTVRVYLPLRKDAGLDHHPPKISIWAWNLSANSITSSP